MFIHLSQFCAYLVPIAGIIVPIILWQIRKNESEQIDQHGRIVVNWIISEFIYFLIFGFLCFFMIGIPFVVALIVASIIFPILGGIKASNGQVWKYPFSISFFKVYSYSRY